MEGAPLSRVLQVRSQLQELVGRVVADRRGVTAVITAIALATLIGFCGLAVDVVMWEVNQRDLQGAADQAALAADGLSECRRNGRARGQYDCPECGLCNRHTVRLSCGLCYRRRLQ